MSFFKEVGKFFTKTLPRETGVFFTKTLPSIGKRETYFPSLPGLRERARALDSALEHISATYTEKMTRFHETRAEYLRLTEDFANRTGMDIKEVRAGRMPSAVWRDPPKNDFDKVMKDVEEGFRSALKFLTFEMSDGLWAPFEGKKERDYLRKRNAHVQAAINRFREAEGALTRASHELRTANARIREKLVELGAEDGDASTIQAHEAEDRAARAMAQRLRAAGMDLAAICRITGLTEEAVAAIPEDESLPGAA